MHQRLIKNHSAKCLPLKPSYESYESIWLHISCSASFEHNSFYIVYSEAYALLMDIGLIGSFGTHNQEK